MSRVLKREQARRDLTQQWVWYAENSGVETADRFLAEAEDSFLFLANRPRAGALVFRKRAELRDLRRWALGGDFANILIFYLPHTDGIELIRVIHGKRNTVELLEEGPIR